MEYQTIAWESMDQSLLLQEEVFGVISKKKPKGIFRRYFKAIHGEITEEIY